MCSRRSASARRRGPSHTGTTRTVSCAQSWGRAGAGDTRHRGLARRRARHRRARTSHRSGCPSALPCPETQPRAQSRGRAWGWRHSAPWSSASPCSSPAETDDALLRLPERVAVPRDSTGSSAPNSVILGRQRRVHSHLGHGQREGDARRLTLARVRCRAPVIN